MECQNIREKLVSYMDGDASSGEKMLIDEHLRSCRKCREYLADLRKTVGYVRGLEDIEPPVWLTHKVMAKIKSEAVQEKGILQILRKLFYPLHIKLPIEAVVAVLMAVTTIYVFRTIQPEMKIERAPSEEIAPQVVPSVPLSPPRISPRDEEQVGEGEFDAEKQLPAGKPEILDRTEVSKAPEVFAKQDQNIPSAGATARSEMKRESLPAGPQEKALSDKRNVAMNIMVNVKNVEIARREIEITVVQLGGKVTGAESAGDEDILIAELDSKKLKRLIEKIKLLGKVEKKEGDLAGTEGDTEIRIEIVNTHR